MRTERLLLKMINACGVCWPLDEERIINILNELERIEDVDGEIAEIGVFQGGTSLLLHTYFPDRIIHLYDTFSGIPETHRDSECLFEAGSWAAKIEDVQRIVGLDKVIYHPGIFPDSFQEHHQRFAFIHSDTDTYPGTLATLNTMFPLLVPGGIIILDDYTAICCPGIKKAVDDWLKTNKDKCKIREHITQCIIIKK